MAMTWLQQMFTPQGSGRYRWQGRPDQGGGEFTGYIPGVYEGDEQNLVFTEPMQVRSDGYGIEGELMPQAFISQTGNGNPVGELDKALEGMASGIGGAPMLKNPRITNWQVPPIFNRGWDANEFSAPGPWDHQLSGMDQLSPNSVSPETSVEHPILAKYVDSRPAYSKSDPDALNLEIGKSSHVVPSTVHQKSTSVGGPSTVTNLRDQLATVRENRANQDLSLIHI